MRSLIVLALALTVTTAAHAAEIRARGPLRVRSQFPLDLVTLDMTPESAFLREPGQTWIALDVVHSNSFEITPAYDAHVAEYEAGAYRAGYDFVVDAEVTRTTIAAEFALGRRFALGFEVPLLAYGGGFMDSTIESFHDTAGLPQNDRDLKARDQFEIDLLAGARRARLDRAETQLGDINLRARFLVAGGDRAAWTVVTEAKAPTGREKSFAGSGEWDYGVAMEVTAGGRRHVFHGGAGHQFLGQPSEWPFRIDDRTTLYAGYELDPNARWSIVMHVMGATSILPSQAGYSQGDGRAELVAGFHYGRDRFRISAGFVENLLTNDNDVDLGVIFGFGWLVGGR